MFPACEFSYIEKRAAFRAVLLALEINCLLDASSVLDGMTFSRRKDLDAVVALAAKHRFAVLPLLVECRPALARERIERDLARGAHAAGDRRPALVDAVVARFDLPPEDVLRIDGEAPMPAMCTQAIAAVAQWRGGRDA